MVSVPYLSLAVVGFLIYRGCKKNERYLEELKTARLEQQTKLADQHTP